MDILITQNEQGLFDLPVKKGDLVGDGSLGTEIMVSLFTDIRAEKDELPPEYGDLRGWWADALFSLQGEGQGTGSKLWLLRRQKQLEAVLVRAETYARDALRWLVNEGLATAVEVTAENPSPGLLALRVAVTRTSPSVMQRVTDVWKVGITEESVTMARDI
ncbi:phage GP46 family protein [Mailhella massiliensis]|uniref:phage GP46 family protein n=1 Tax=Mailhella massiliensis TaxID=1903261 RepID=UPI00097DAF38|nr:phage GP46 family protein [Mailhella massiliensis]